MSSPPSQGTAHSGPKFVCTTIVLVIIFALALGSAPPPPRIPQTTSTSRPVQTPPPPPPRTPEPTPPPLPPYEVPHPPESEAPNSTRERRTVARSVHTLAYRRPDDEVDCDYVWRTLAHLYRESQQRQGVWEAAGQLPPVLTSNNLTVSEMHILLTGDSWSRLNTFALSRHIDACRMRVAQPLMERHECTVHHTTYPGGHAVYQITKSALGVAASSSPEGSDIVRIHLYYHLKRYMVQVAAHLQATLTSGTPTPSLSDETFPRQAQCRRSLLDEVQDLDGQMPLCLCVDTLMLPGNRHRRVPVDAIQVINGMWDTQLQVMPFDLFDFQDRRVDWFFRQQRFSPDLSTFPYLTWEDNVKRFRQLMADTYVTVIRDAVSFVSARNITPMPRVLLSQISRPNCKSSRFRSLTTLNSTQRCEELAWPLHDVLNEVVDAAYGKPLLDLPPVNPPEWLRLVNYRPLSITESSLYHSDPKDLTGDEGLCSMSDGVHFDTQIFWRGIHRNEMACAKKADILFWDNLRRG